MWSIFKSEPEKPKTDEELLAEYHAFVDTVIAKQYMLSYDERRYEDFLKEIYKRKLTPPKILKPKD